MKQNDKFRIWDNGCKIFVDDSASLHCASNWCVSAFTGELRDYIESVDMNCEEDYLKTYTLSRDPGYYFKGSVPVKRKRYILQQFTGAKDSNKNPIYAGDIITFKPKNTKGPFYEIKYDDEYCMFAMYDKKGIILLSEDDEEPFYIRGEHVRVMGNIFENPELLK
jgi:uncharacterized phage protein (TIGR01671 family)